jgi:CO/xanthine dehydrogenase FAD-binding subunit
VVAVRRVRELHALRIDAKEIRVGAAVCYGDLTGTRGIAPAVAPVLHEAARSMGSTQIRWMGTLGGNIGTASSVGDALCALMALDARATVASATASREVPVAELVRSGLVAGELIVDLRWPLASGPQRFLKVCRRAAVSRSVVSVSFVAEADAGSSSVRIVLGGCGPRPLRVSSAERLASELSDNGRFSPEAAAAVADRVRAELDPPSDIAGTSAYRRHAAGVLVRRALTGGTVSLAAA